MGLFVPRRRFDPDVPELMDRPGSDPEILRDDLANLRTINKYFGGLAATRKSIQPLFSLFPKDHEITVLDLATGSGDQPVSLVNLARTEQRSIRIHALDKNPVMRSVAASFCSAYPEITVGEADLLHLDFPDRSFDLVLCSLAIHHFSNEDAVRILRIMKRVSRIAVVVHDLNRSWVTAWTAWLYSHLTTRNPMTLFDSYLSSLRAFTRDELASLALEAGISHYTIARYPFFRLVLVGRTD